jgi:hypothetical protein
MKEEKTNEKRRLKGGGVGAGPFHTNVALNGSLGLCPVLCDIAYRNHKFAGFSDSNLNPL